MEIRKVGILGSGRLGRGIAENAASKGYDVILFSQGAGSQNTPKRIEASLDKKLAKWAITESEKRVILSRIHYTSDLKELAHVDLVVEATIDQFYTKQELLRTADHLCKPEVVFISTSGTLTVSELSRGINRTQSLVGLRFIPPVPYVPVVELSTGYHTSEQAVQVAKRFAARLGKEIVEVNESPGLVNPRALVSLINEAAYLLDEGVATAAGIEKIYKDSWNMDQGPFEMADRMGLDNILHWMEQLQEEFGDRYAPCPLLRRYVRKGRLGVKTTLGFFSYTPEGNMKANLEQEDAE